MNNLNLLIADTPMIGAERTEPVQDTAILQLAHATIGLSQVAPQLSEMAAGRQAEAERQANHVRNIVNMTREMTTTLDQTVRQLRISTREIGDLSSMIRSIANATRMIAINTSIAAAHAGKEGRAFAVLAKEIRMLSENAAAATKDVQEKVERLQENTLRTAQAIGLEEGGGESLDKRGNGRGLAWLLECMDEADVSASRQANEARELNKLGLSLRELSEQMISSVGAFRLQAHNRVEELVEELRADYGMRSDDPGRQASVLRLAVKRCPFVELAYATDARGVQVTENISRRDFQAAYGTSGLNKNWSQRPWFRGAVRTDGVYLSEIYRSAATDEFCLTASATFSGKDGRVMGVVAIDVNFREILGDDGL
ncbi:MAG TPA: methyl-accepting chemotaxis protein [Gammaproteobacteria bacterium]|nr:methyl-accepting chemotaxis protein [Gammaproteobacteria bacterium]